MNNQDQKHQNYEESPKNGLGEPQASSWKRMLSKKWVYPAAYMATAAIILTLVWVYQNASQKPQVKTTSGVVSSVNSTKDGMTTTPDGKTVPTTAVPENLAWPVANAADVKVAKPFYDKEASESDHVAAVVQYKDQFIPNTGIDLSREDNAPFNVVASLSGTVTSIQQHTLLGYVVEVTNANNLKTVYESLTDVKVKKNDQVKQGDTLGTAGRNEYEKDLGNHVHFAIYENGTPVNPTTLLPQK
ncbi:stage II sporulation protein Q [Paenibacillus shirakamiensis]|uniref:Stage II sporulation protein Q n=1 Tax=Paenibacillus shirakamiensis TaxID=1265935 RepID=A0ABS4JJD5_9BACL|nr:M23 family metallopeptidase [Paenibacillus shirakamiensis]MBP2001807.1 stage II sporulation protein Q [Paenibacillus shirakamiensis]